MTTQPGQPSERVRILNVGRVNTPLPNGEFQRMIEITYEAIGLSPRRVYLPAELDSTQERQKRIREDLDSARELRPTLFDTGRP